jgi:hypothetical protein
VAGAGALKWAGMMVLKAHRDVTVLIKSATVPGI